MIALLMVRKLLVKRLVSTGVEVGNVKELEDGEEKVIRNVEILWILEFVEAGAEKTTKGVVVVWAISTEDRVFIEVGGEVGSINIKLAKAFAVDALTPREKHHTVELNMIKRIYSLITKRTENTTFKQVFSHLTDTNSSKSPETIKKHLKAMQDMYGEVRAARLMKGNQKADTEASSRLFKLVPKAPTINKWHNEYVLKSKKVKQSAKDNTKEFITERFRDHIKGPVSTFPALKIFMEGIHALNWAELNSMQFNAFWRQFDAIPKGVESQNSTQFENTLNCVECFKFNAKGVELRRIKIYAF